MRANPHSLAVVLPAALLAGCVANAQRAADRMINEINLHSQGQYTAEEDEKLKPMKKYWDALPEAPRVEPGGNAGFGLTPFKFVHIHIAPSPVPPIQYMTKYVISDPNGSPPPVYSAADAAARGQAVAQDREDRQKRYAAERAETGNAHAKYEANTKDQAALESNQRAIEDGYSAAYAAEDNRATKAAADDARERGDEARMALWTRNISYYEKLLEAAETVRGKEKVAAVGEVSAFCDQPFPDFFFLSAGSRKSRIRKMKGRAQAISSSLEAKGEWSIPQNAYDWATHVDMFYRKSEHRTEQYPFMNEYWDAVVSRFSKIYDRFQRFDPNSGPGETNPFAGGAPAPARRKPLSELVEKDPVQVKMWDGKWLDGVFQFKAGGKFWVHFHLGDAYDDADFDADHIRAAP